MDLGCSGADGIAAVYIKRDPGEDHLYAFLTDHLGSVQAVTDSTGFVCQHNGTAQEYNFDPWGRRRNPADLSYNGIPAEFLILRGFTGHEHHDPFDIINMNGRIYDPVLSRFLSPDNYVQMPDYSQSFNRYTYCLNNPLVYTDPDGEWFITVLFMLGNAYLNGVMANDFRLNPGKWDWNSFDTYFAIASGLISGYHFGKEVENLLKNHEWKEISEPFSLPSNSNSPNGELPIINKEFGGCAWGTYESMCKYEFPYDFSFNNTSPADFSDLAKTFYSTTEILYAGESHNLWGMGKELSRGKPLALTYRSGFIEGEPLYHCVGIQKLQIQYKEKILLKDNPMSKLKYRAIAQIMDSDYLIHRRFIINPGEKRIIKIESLNNNFDKYVLFNILMPFLFR